jgi:hypothetical protein
MRRLDSGVVVSIFDRNNTLVWSRSFGAKWETATECAAQTNFMQQKLETLGRTYFPVRAEHVAMFSNMQAALRQASGLEASLPKQPETVSMARDMSCGVTHTLGISDTESHLKVYFGSLVLGYRVGGAYKTLNVDAPALCCHYMSTDGHSIVVNSYTRPERKAETPLPARHTIPLEAAPAPRARASFPCQAVFSQHFVVTQQAHFKQAPVRKVLAGRDINRSLPCYARYQAHRDARRLAKAEHDAVRRACGFSDAAWDQSELSCRPQFLVWATPHVGADVHVASVFLH